MFFEKLLLIILILLVVLVLFRLLCFIQRGWNRSPMRDFIHNVMDDHVPEDIAHFDGASIFSKCKICNKTIIRDSHGNWFSVTDDND